MTGGVAGWLLTRPPAAAVGAAAAATYSFRHSGPSQTHSPGGRTIRSTSYTGGVETVRLPARAYAFSAALCVRFLTFLVYAPYTPLVRPFRMSLQFTVYDVVIGQGRTDCIVT